MREHERGARRAPRAAARHGDPGPHPGRSADHSVQRHEQHQLGDAAAAIALRARRQAGASVPLDKGRRRREARPHGPRHARLLQGYSKSTS